MLRNVALLLLSSVIGLALIEVLLVLKPELQAENAPESHVFCEGPVQRTRPLAEFGWAEIPHSAYFERKTEADGWAVHIYNQDGFRDVFNSGSRNVVVLGDSFTRGTLVHNDETFAHLLDRWHPDVAFQNFGMGGHGTGNAYHLYQSIADGIDHDLVVLGYFVGNDPIDNLRDHSSPDGRVVWPSLPRGEQETEPDERSALLKLHVLLRTYSRAYSLLYVSLKKAWHGAHPSLVMSAAAQTEAVDLTRTILHDLVEAAASRGAEVLVVVLPYWNEMVDRTAKEFADRQRALLAELPGRYGHVHVLDVEPVIRAAGPAQSFGKVDKHFNRYGQYLTARAIYDWINQTWPHGPFAPGPAPAFQPERGAITPDCAAIGRYREAFERAHPEPAR